MLVAVLGIVTNAQTPEKTFEKEGTTYSSVKKSKASSERETGFTWEDSKGNTYPIYMGQSGACYVKKISSKSGNEYKQYLGEEISADICAQLGVKYTPKK